MIRTYAAALLLFPCFAMAQSEATKHLEDAIGREDVAAVRQALSEGADVNYSPKGAPRLLYDAIQSHNPEILRAMLERNPRRESLDELLLEVAGEGAAAAIKSGSDEAPIDETLPAPWGEPAAQMMEMLLRAGADPNFHESSQGLTALEVAAGEGATEVVEALLRHGAQIDAADNDGGTPLMLAACECMAATPPDATGALKALLERGAALNLQDKDGDTALMRAADRGNGAAVRLLLRYGADSTVKNKSGDTALSLARKADHQDIVQMLAQYKR